MKKITQKHNSATEVKAGVADDRFQAFNDARFKRMPPRDKKIQIDQRFSKLLTDKQFHKHTFMDPYGRRKQSRQQANNSLKEKFYLPLASDVEHSNRGNSIQTSLKKPLHRTLRRFRELNRDYGDTTLSLKHIDADCTGIKGLKQPHYMKNGSVEEASDCKAEIYVPDPHMEKHSFTNILNGHAPMHEDDDFNRRSKQKQKTESAYTSNKGYADTESTLSDTGDEEQSEGSSAASSETSETEDEVDSDVDVSASVWNSEGADLLLGEATSRVAIMGCEWHAITAVDLLVIIQSFLEGHIRSDTNNALTFGAAVRSVKKVSIYPSDYGLKNLEKEKFSGQVLDDESENKKDSNNAFVASASQDVDAAVDASEDIAADDTPNVHSSDFEGIDVDKNEKHYSGIISLYKTTEEEELRNQEILRKYQAQRAKYYFAVVECDSVEVATKIYDELDGLDTEICLDGMDLRFVPDSVVFPNPPVSIASEVPHDYEPPTVLYRSALKHSRVTCTWDEPEPARAKLFVKRFTPKELERMDIEAFVGSETDFDTSDNETMENMGTFKCVDETNLAAYRKALLGGLLDRSSSDEEITEKLKPPSSEEFEAENKNSLRLDMQLNSYLEGLNVPCEINKDEAIPARKRENAIRKTPSRNVNVDRQELDSDASSYHSQANLADLELLAMDGQNNHHFDMRKDKTSKRKQEQSHDLSTEIHDGSLREININDERFNKLFTSLDFEIDPTNPSFKNTLANRQLLAEKRKRAKAAKQRSFCSAIATSQQQQVANGKEGNPGSFNGHSAMQHKHNLMSIDSKLLKNNDSKDITLFKVSQK